MSTNYRTRDDASPNNNTCTGAPGEKPAMSKSPERPGPFGQTDGYGAHDEIGRRKPGENLNYKDVPYGAGKLSMPKEEPKENYKVHTVAIKHGSSADGHIKGNGDAFSYLGHFRSGKNLESGHNVGMPGTPDPKSLAGGAMDTGLSAATGGLLGGSAPKQVMRPGIEARATGKQLKNPKFAASHPVAEAQAEVRKARKGASAFAPGTDAALSSAKEKVGALKGERKAAFSDIKAARAGVREAKKGAAVRKAGGVTAGTSSEDVKTARQSLKSAKTSAKTRFKGAYQKKFGPKQYA